MAEELRGQPLLPNNRAQGAWFSLLTDAMGARSKTEAREIYQKAQGYMAALRDVELIDAANLKLMDTKAMRALNDAFERLHAAKDADQL